MILVENKITLAEIKELAKEKNTDFVKAVIDIEKKIMVIGGAMHVDEEALLLEGGSCQENLWGINIYPFEPDGNRIEFDSMINIRPFEGNRTRDVENPETRKRIIDTVNNLVS